MAREGSRTGWLPDTTPMYAMHWQRGAWQLMAHENAFLQFLQDFGDRGHDQVGSINWIMGMAQRNAGPGRLQLRAMFSAELLARAYHAGARIAEIPVTHLPRRAGRPTGARPKVIAKAFAELLTLRRQPAPR